MSSQYNAHSMVENSHFSTYELRIFANIKFNKICNKLKLKSYSYKKKALEHFNSL